MKHATPTRVACFDLDSTLILSARGERAAGTVKDWVWAYPNVPETLKAFRDAGWVLVIVSNRSGPPWAHKGTQARVEELFRRVGFTFWFLGATKHDSYRKPAPGMVELFSQLASVKEWDPQSFVCGDAAGVKSSDPWHRWSDADAGLAKAAGLTFYEPQERFGSFPVPVVSATTRLIITVGIPGSGWDQFVPYTGQTLPYGTRKVFIGSSETKVSQRPDGIDLVLVCGSHATEASRAEVMTRWGATSTAIYWYARPALDGSQDKQYIAQCQPPVASATTEVFRVN